jgi:hypothetical protein
VRKGPPPPRPKLPERYIARMFDYGSTTNDEINAEIASLRGDGYELVSFNDNRETGKLEFAFERRKDVRTR